MKIQLCKPVSLHELGQRDNQEDFIFPRLGEATEEDRIFVLCDGMGGCEYGEVASKIVSEAIASHLNTRLCAAGSLTDEDIHQALNSAYELLDQAKAKRPDANSMGTTLTIVALHGKGAIVAHIGDSRIYHVRPETQEILYRSKDHSLVQQLYELGELTYEEMKTSQQKNIILKAVMPGEDKRTTPDIVHIADLRSGDYFFMCTDGILENIDDDDIMAVCLDDKMSDEEKMKLFGKKTANNQDNHSAHLIRIKEVIREAGDENILNDEPEARASNKALNDPKRLMASITNSGVEPDNDDDVSIAEDVDDKDIAESSDVNVVESFQINNTEQEYSSGDSTRQKPKNNTLFIIISILVGIIIAVAVFFFLSGNNDDPTNVKPTLRENTDNNVYSKPPTKSPRTQDKQQPQKNEQLTEEQGEQQPQPQKPDKLDEEYQQAVSGAQKITDPSKNNGNAQTPPKQNPTKQSSAGALNNIIQEQVKPDDNQQQ